MNLWIIFNTTSKVSRQLVQNLITNISTNKFSKRIHSELKERSKKIAQWLFRTISYKDNWPKSAIMEINTYESFKKMVTMSRRMHYRELRIKKLLMVTSTWRHHFHEDFFTVILINSVKCQQQASRVL